MNISLEYLKETVALFAEQATSMGLTSYGKDNIPEIISSDVYDFMQFLEEQLLAKHLVHRFNYDIQSNSITDSLKDKTYPEAFKSNQFLLPFLHHLAIQGGELSAEDLDDFMLSFLQKHAELLSIYDVVVSKTGATRALTNIRFAVNTLREFHFIESRTATNKRSLSPTIIGMLSLIFLKLSADEDLTNDKTILTEGFKSNNKPCFYWQVPWAITKSPESLIGLLNRFIISDPDLLEMDKIKKLITEFCSFICEYVKVNEQQGIVTLDPKFPSNFKSFISSPDFNWKHTPTIKVLRDGYRKLWQNPIESTDMKHTN